YRYEGSPIVVPDGTPEPPDDPMDYLPVARPGSRAPHLWLKPGQSILDTFGTGFTLLRLGGGADAATAPDAAALVQAAASLGVALDVVDVAGQAARDAYAAPLVLVRPDGHVGW